MIKRNGFFKRKKKDSRGSGPVTAPAAAAGDDEEIIDLEEIIEDAAAEVGDEVLVASKLGLDVNLDDIDLDGDAFSKEFDAEQNALLDAVSLDDASDQEQGNLDAELKALLTEDADSAPLAPEAKAPQAAAAAEESLIRPSSGLPETAEAASPKVLDVPADREPEPVAQEAEALHLLETEEQPLDLEVEVEQPPIVPPPAAVTAPPKPTVQAAPAVDEALLDELLNGIEERLQHAVRRVVAEQLPTIVGEILREEIDRLKR